MAGGLTAAAAVHIDCGLRQKCAATGCVPLATETTSLRVLIELRHTKGFLTCLILSALSQRVLQP